jgi:hypothetical protein
MSPTYPAFGGRSAQSFRTPKCGMIHAVKVQLLFFDGCPHWTTMEEHLLEALVVTDKAEAIERCVVETQETADAYRFAGSPLIRLDGRDPFTSSPENSA